MRKVAVWSVAWLTAIGCGGGGGQPGLADAPGLDALCSPQVLLAGGSDVAAQGWLVTRQDPATLSYGADYVELQTSTAAGARTSGQLLVYRPTTLPPGTPFAIQIVLRISAVAPHNALDSAAAILASYVPPFGTTAERDQMIYLDPGQVGWADDSQAAPAAAADGAYHTYELTVDASAVARLKVDGVATLSRAGFVTNGTIALGDQTNEANLDGTLRIRSVTRLCL